MPRAARGSIPAIAPQPPRRQCGAQASVRMSNTFQTRLCFESVDTGLRSREDALSALKNTIFLSGAHPAADGAAWRDAQRVVDEACVACATIALRHALAKADGQIDPAGPIDRRGLVDAMDREAQENPFLGGLSLKDASFSAGGPFRRSP
ncbi:hypothetical protein M885DRAFT_265068 [Pelagophyceae sp. CCMP2097]|nr:hypothetical protein M885DRAFT_265068 [Pelagophyceae sp. CCMP2097]